MFNGHLPTTYTTQHRTPGSCLESFEFTDSGEESREQLDLECFMGRFGNENNFISDNVNGIFYDNEYERGVLLSVRTSNTPHPTAIIPNNQFISLVNDEQDNYIESDTSEVINEICEPREVSSSKNLACPNPCTSDLRGRANAEVQDCIMNSRHRNGCDQCMNDYFKKHYNYSCVSCKDALGNCTDFLGSQQCENSIRAYDHR